MRLARAGRAPAALCFVAGEGGVATDHVVHLPREGATAAQAARLGHLWQHVLDDAPTFAPAAGEACAEWLTRSLAAEARGDAVEARVAAALGEPPPKLTRARSRDAAYASRCP